MWRVVATATSIKSGRASSQSSTWLLQPMKQDLAMETVAATNNKWEPRAKRPAWTYEEIIDSPCSYHNHEKYKATHS